MSPSVPAFTEVFRQHVPFAWRCLRRLGVAAGDADDVCQEVFLVVYRKLADLDPEASLRAYIYGVCLKKAADHRKKAHVRREAPADALPESDSALAGPDVTLDHRRALAKLDVALMALDEDKRAAFVLYEVEGLSLQEIASASGCPLQTVYSRLTAARRHVESSLAETREELR